MAIRVVRLGTGRASGEGVRLATILAEHGAAMREE